MSKKREMQALIRRYREEHGVQSVDMKDVARYAAAMGWRLPPAKTGLDRLAEQFSNAAREEMRIDTATGKPYRANLAYTSYQGSQQYTLWDDIDKAPRDIAHRAFKQRREQMVGDAVQLSFDVLHWNRVNAEDEPIEMPMDFTDDVAWRMNAPDNDKAA